MRFLKKVLAKGIKWGAGSVNPVIGLEFDPDPPDARDVTPGEYEAVYKLANERMQIAMELGDITGQDAQEVRSLRWMSKTMGFTSDAEDGQRRNR